MDMVVCDTTAVILQQGERYLITQRRYPPEQGSWGFPGGHLEPGETPRACAIRECMEEVGPADIDKKPLMTFTHEWGIGNRHTVAVFRGTLKGEPVAGSDVAAARWATAEDMKRLDMANFALQIMNAILFGKHPKTVKGNSTYHVHE